MLSVTEQQLARISQRADRMYRPGPSTIKSDLTLRETWDAFPQLKRIQGRIKQLILDKVEFPFYLNGGIKGRDYRKNAAVHSASSLLLTEDISNFFPSISTDAVENIWRHFFHFPAPVAHCLARLTTRLGELPQGARTSNHLANLALRHDEPNVVARFQQNGIRYTRLVDDISASTRRRISPHQKTMMVGEIIGMLARNRFRAKRRKHALTTRGQSMTVTKLRVNGWPSLPLEKRKQVRAAVYQFEALAATDGDAAHVSHAYNVVAGRVFHLKRFHPAEGKRLVARLLLVRPAVFTR